MYVDAKFEHSMASVQLAYAPTRWHIGARRANRPAESPSAATPSPLWAPLAPLRIRAASIRLDRPTRAYAVCAYVARAYRRQ